MSKLFQKRYIPPLNLKNEPNSREIPSFERPIGAEVQSRNHIPTFHVFLNTFRFGTRVKD